MEWFHFGCTMSLFSPELSCTYFVEGIVVRFCFGRPFGRAVMLSCWFPPVGVCCLCGLPFFVVLQLLFFGLLLMWYVFDVFGSSIGRAVVFWCSVSSCGNSLFLWLMWAPLVCLQLSSLGLLVWMCGLIRVSGWFPWASVFITLELGHGESFSFVVPCEWTIRHFSRGPCCSRFLLHTRNHMRHMPSHSSPRVTYFVPRARLGTTSRQAMGCLLPPRSKRHPIDKHSLDTHPAAPGWVLKSG